MKLILANPNGRVGSNSGETDVIGNIFGAARVDVSEPQRGGVASHHVECSLVDVDGPHGAVCRLESEAQGEGPPTATQVEEVSARRGRGSVRKKYPRARVNAVGTENTVRRHELIFCARQINMEGTQLGGTCRR